MFDRFKKSSSGQKSWTKADQDADDKRIAYEAGERKIRGLVAKHLDELTHARRLGLKVGQFGTIDDSQWNKTARTFMNQIILPVLGPSEVAAIVQKGLSTVATELIERPVKQHMDKVEKAFESTVHVDALTPIAFERYCANRLTSSGWKCELTKASGDQGVDVIARLNSFVVAIQCKKYSSPVGNNAVQEVYAAKAHVRATHAAVVTNATFTRSAIELAGSTDVLLLHHSDLPGLQSMVTGRKPVNRQLP